MTADEFITYLTWAIYIAVFLITAVHAVRHPLRANVDIALLFFLPALVISLTVAANLGLIARTDFLSDITLLAVLGMTYMLLRLVYDFSDVPAWLMRAAEVALVALTVTNLVFTTAPTWLVLVEVAYMLAVLFYVTLRLLGESRHSSGVTKRRMRAVAVGCLGLFAVFLIAALNLLLPDLRMWLRPVTELATLASAVSFYLGFAPPTLLRRAWQEPELRAFLSRAASLPRLPTTEAIMKELEQGAATSLGAPNASIGLWHEDSQVLRFEHGGRTWNVPATMNLTAGKAFLTQQPAFSPEVKPENPLYSVARSELGVRAVMAAPITAGNKKLGVLTAYAPRAPIFAHEDLSLLHLLADQASVILESRALIDEASRVRAREEVTKLKEDFLSAAAHDLKTPLTILVTQTELLERRALRAPNAPADVASLRRLKKEVYRLKTLVLELLDASRAEQGRLVGERVPVDLVAAAQEICSLHGSLLHPCTVVAEGPLMGEYDPTRIQQLIGNLVENGVKYSPDGGPIRIRLWREDGWNRIAVSDCGIGIPAGDLPNIFERFHRGTNVDDRRFAGMGLGLYICHGIAEEHGGRIWVESGSSDSTGKSNGRGAIGEIGKATGAVDDGTTGDFRTTFQVALPASVLVAG
jgi:signal transduction histidine kinase